jgi:hypothetical protein
MIKRFLVLAFSLKDDEIHVWIRKRINAHILDTQIFHQTCESFTLFQGDVLLKYHHHIIKKIKKFICSLAFPINNQTKY